MYARVHFMNTQPENRNEVTQFIWETVLPSAREWPGVKGYLALWDPNTGKSIAIALWETEADMRASAASNPPLIVEAARFLTSAPTQEVYEVLVQE
jgi:hypothetical protein